MRIASILASAFLCLALAGCSNIKYAGVGGEVNPKPYSNVVSLAPSCSELIGGFGGRLTGRTASCDYPPQIEGVAVIMSGTRPNFEEIEARQTKFIVYDHELLGEADVQKLKSLGIDTFDMGATTLQEHFDKVLELGGKIMTEVNASDYVDGVRKAVDLAKQDAVQPPQKVAVMLPGQGGEHLVVGVDSFLADLLKNIGTEPVGPKGSLFVPVNPEQLAQMNPDVIIVGGEGTSLMRDPRLANVAAIKNHKVYEFKNQAVLVRRGYRLTKLVEALSGALHGGMKSAS